MNNEKCELIESLGIHFEKMYNIPPLASRILGTLIIDGCKSGLTFDELVLKMQASKSSVSTNLNLLLKMEKINYFTIAGDRKKYFKAAPLSQRLKNYQNLVNDEKVLMEKIVNYRKSHLSCSQEKINLQNGYAYLEHILQVEKLLTNTIEKFTQIEKANQAIK